MTKIFGTEKKSSIGCKTIHSRPSCRDTRIIAGEEVIKNAQRRWDWTRRRRPWNC
jgi:hypothetical protein